MVFLLGVTSVYSITDIPQGVNHYLIPFTVNHLSYDFVGEKESTSRWVQTSPGPVNFVSYVGELVEGVCFIRASCNQHLDLAVQCGKTICLLSKDEHDVHGVRGNGVAGSFGRSHKPDALHLARLASVHRLFGVLILVPVDPRRVTP